MRFAILLLFTLTSATVFGQSTNAATGGTNSTSAEVLSLSTMAADIPVGGGDNGASTWTGPIGEGLAAAADVPESVSTIVKSIEAIAAALFALSTVILGLYARFQTLRARTVQPMIQAVEEYGCEKLKGQIHAKAEAAGVEKTLNKLVESETQFIKKEQETKT